MPSPGSPCGMPKLKTAAVDVPLFVTVGALPYANEVTPPAVIVPDGPVGPVAPDAPVGPTTEPKSTTEPIELVMIRWPAPFTVPDTNPGIGPADDVVLSL